MTVWLQDTDCNDNAIFDREETLFAEDGDLGPDMAGAIFTDFNLNGIDDDWEIDNDDDPTFDDGDTLVDDVMAYAEIPAYLVTVKNDNDPLDNGTVYAILDTSASAPQIGDKMTGSTLFSTYEYGGKTGIGSEDLTSGNVVDGTGTAHAEVVIGGDGIGHVDVSTSDFHQFQ